MNTCCKVVRISQGRYFSYLIKGPGQIEYRLGEEVVSKTPILVFDTLSHAESFKVDTYDGTATRIMRCTYELPFPIVYVGGPMFMSNAFDGDRRIRQFWRKYKQIIKAGQPLTSTDGVLQVSILQMYTRLWTPPAGTFGVYKLKPFDWAHPWQE